MSDHVTPKEVSMNNINYVEGIIRHMITQENPTHAQDIAQELADAGLITPDLPEPDDDEFGPTWTQVFNYRHGPNWTDVKGSVDAFNGIVEIQGNDTHIHTPEEARELALALLAAANHSEGKA